MPSYRGNGTFMYVYMIYSESKVAENIGGLEKPARVRI